MARPRILYIEDNAANLALVRKVLEHGGAWEVVGAATGEEGLACVDAEGFALVLVDLDLPGIDGIAVTRRLREDPRTANVPIVALSAGVMKHEREQALAAGCEHFLEKPFDIAELRRIVRELLGS
jgi:two-component system cell cycle response regulator DivK